MTADAAAGPLVSWTRTLNEDDALALLDAARPGMPLPEWEAAGDGLLPQPSRPRRRETIRMVRDELLDHDGAAVAGSTFLRLLAGSPHRRSTLLRARLHARRAWVTRALDELVAPALAAAEAPLAPTAAAAIPAAAWAAFVDRHVAPPTPPSARQKTRSTLQTTLARLGVVTLDTARDRGAVAHRAEPEALAFGWLLLDELRATGRAEAPASWAGTDSLAARLFLPRPDWAARCVDAAVSAGLLREGYLAGASRLHPGEA